MLVIARRHGEQIIIRVENVPDITITMIHSSPGKCRLGIDAPPEVKILREELEPR